VYTTKANHGRRLAAVTFGASMILTGHSFAQELPDTMAWTSYDVGSAGHAEASAIADAFGREFGTKVRIQPSGSSVGRLQPVLTGRADLGFLATETFFAAEGTEDFAERRWGPQDLRVIAGRPASTGMVAAADSGVETIADVKGKRVAFTAGNPSINVKCSALLSFGGLTEDDVEIVMFPTYAAAQGSLASGEADVTCGTTNSSAMYQLEASPRGIRWLPVPASNEEGWKRLQQVAPFFAPFKETAGAGVSEEKPAEIVSLRYPIIVVPAEKNADEVYAFTKALDETFDLYKNATKVTERWSLGEAGTPPIDAPFHEGAIRYLKEKGIWTEEHDAWNEARLARLNALRAAWDKTVAEGKDLSDEDYASLWQERREEALASLD
jgi:TRAP transporter TAXI family solute receptor